MEDIVTLFSLSLAMLAGCYLAGIIPLTVTLSEEKLRMVTVLGAGLLVGTALAVIIPEGVHAMYSDGKGHSHHHDHSLELSNLQVKETHHHMDAAESLQGDEAGGDHHDHLKASAGQAVEGVGGGVLVASAAVGGEGEIGEHAEHGHHDMVEEHSKIGMSLVFGFIFMLLVDQIGGSLHSHSHHALPSDLETAAVQGHNRNKITATLGLVVHAAADGIALGAAVTLSENHITMIVFAAIMLHKAPAAFGLVSFLLHEGLDRTRVRKHLAIFSAAAPFMAIVTYLGLGQQSKETLRDLHTTGIAMLFSAGTFLYVATVHVLPEISTSHTQHTAPDGTVIVRESKGFKKTELLALVCGSLLPVVLAVGHKH